MVTSILSIYLIYGQYGVNWQFFACYEFKLMGHMKPVRTPVAIFGSLGVCIYVPASRPWLISYSPIHLTQPDVIV